MCAAAQALYHFILICITLIHIGSTVILHIGSTIILHIGFTINQLYCSISHLFYMPTMMFLFKAHILK